MASPFLRCVQTAAAVLDGLHLPQNALEYDWQICEVFRYLCCCHCSWTGQALSRSVAFLLAQVLTRNALAGSQWDPPALPIDAWMWACKQSGAAKSTEPPSTQTACDSTALTQQVAQERHECCAGAGQQPDAALLGARPVELAPGTIIHGPAPAFPETIEAVHARYTAALQAIADRHAGHNVLVVTHGEAVNRSVTRLVRTTPVPSLHIQSMPCCMSWKNRWDGGDMQGGDFSDWAVVCLADAMGGRL